MTFCIFVVLYTGSNLVQEERIEASNPVSPFVGKEHSRISRCKPLDLWNIVLRYYSSLWLVHMACSQHFQDKQHSSYALVDGSSPSTVSLSLSVFDNMGSKSFKAILPHTVHLDTNDGHDSRYQAHRNPKPNRLRQYLPQRFFY